MRDRSKTIKAIAKRQLGIDSFDVQGRDSEDFREVAIWRLKAMLYAAYEAGYEAAASARPKAVKP